MSSNRNSGASSPPPRDPGTLRELGRFIGAYRLADREIHARQSEIYSATLSLSRLIDRPNFSKVGGEDVRRMIELYDEYFFDGRILPVARAEGISFGLSSRMTKIAGKMVTHYPEASRSGRRRFELVLSSTLLFQTFEEASRPVEVTGRSCRNRLEAMQRVAEHELVHLVEMLVWNEGNCSQPRFQSIARRCFAHTDFRHDLITQRERAARKFGIRIGDRVAFVNGGHRLVGRVNRITRRATVLVPDPRGAKFSDGECYTRYYVPLEKMQRIADR